MFRVPRVALTATLLLGLSACGDDDTTGNGTTATVAESEAPQRIISLSPTHTEILFAIGAADQVIAIDDQSNYPPEALEKQHDLSGFEPSVEAIAKLDPDLVVIAYDPIDLTGQLTKLGIEVWMGDAPATFDDVYAQIEDLGAATGHVAEAAELVSEMRADIAEVVAGVTVPAEPLTYYHELDNTFYTVTSTTFVGQVYGLFGLVSIADGVEEGNDYPQLSAEHIVASNPDLVFLADAKYSGESQQTVESRPGWDAIGAVAAGRVAIVDDDVASRWGPRLVDFVSVVADAIAAAQTAAG